MSVTKYNHSTPLVFGNVLTLKPKVPFMTPNVMERTLYNQLLQTCNIQNNKLSTPNLLTKLSFYIHTYIPIR